MGCVCQLAMDRKDREREMASSLISQLCPDVISYDQLNVGFTKLLATVEVSVGPSLSMARLRFSRPFEHQGVSGFKTILVTHSFRDHLNLKV
jgi:hypothetical protein